MRFLINVCTQKHAYAQQVGDIIITTVMNYCNCSRRFERYFIAPLLRYNDDYY